MAWIPVATALASAASSMYGARKAGKQAKRSQNQERQSNEQAQSYFQQNPQAAHNIFDPYMNKGAHAESLNPYLYAQMGDMYSKAPDLYGNMPNLYEEPSEMSRGYGDMAGDPQEYINKIMRGYTPSEGYKYKEGRMRDEARSAAASGGFSGTNFDEERRANMIRGLLGEDQQQYLGNVGGAHQAGMSGLERLLQGRERGQTQRLGGMERGQTERLGGRERAMKGHAEMGEFQANRGFNAAQALAEALIGTNNQAGGLSFLRGRDAANYGAESRKSQNDLVGRFAGQMPELLKSMQGMRGGAPAGAGAGGWRANPNNLY